MWDDHEVGDNTWKDGMADQNNTEESFSQYDIEFGGAGVSFNQRKMNAVRAVSVVFARPEPSNRKATC